MNTFIKFFNFMSQDRAFDSHCHFLGRAFVQNDCPKERALQLHLRGLSQEEVAVTDDIDSHIFISYFSVVDPDEIILDETRY